MTERGTEERQAFRAVGADPRTNTKESKESRDLARTDRGGYTLWLHMPPEQGADLRFTWTHWSPESCGQRPRAGHYAGPGKTGLWFACDTSWELLLNWVIRRN